MVALVSAFVAADSPEFRSGLALALALAVVLLVAEPAIVLPVVVPGPVVDLMVIPYIGDKPLDTETPDIVTVRRTMG